MENKDSSILVDDTVLLEKCPPYKNACCQYKLIYIMRLAELKAFYYAFIKNCTR